MCMVLSELSPEAISAKSETLCHHITHFISTNKRALEVQTIAIFAAHGAEVNLATLHQLLPEKTFLYPLCRPQRQLSFHIVTSIPELIPGSMSILEPQSERHIEVPLADADLILCPGLAFGKDGSRLGHGGGYYDRALHSLSIPTCGVAFQNQVHGTVPHDHHDIAMNFIITETGVYPTKPDRGS